MLKFCPNCGAKVIGSGKFCVECGISFEELLKEQQAGSAEPASAEKEDVPEEKALSGETQTTDVSESEPETEPDKEMVPVDETDNRCFPLAGDTLQFGHELDLYNSVRREFVIEAYRNKNIFCQAYRENVSGFDSMCECGVDLFYERIRHAISLGVDILVKFGVREYDYSRLLKKYLERVDVDSYLDVLQKKVGEVEETVNNLKEYRNSQRNSRSEWAGGGFGLSGAISGAMKAGMLNMGTRAIRGIGDSITDSNDRRKIEKMKERVFEDTAIVSSLEYGVGCCSFNVFIILADILGIDADIQADAALARFNIAVDQMKRNQISLEAFQRELLEVIRLNPFEVQPYVTLYMANDQLNKEIVPVAEYFGVLEEYTYTISGMDQQRLRENVLTDKDTLENIAKKREVLQHILEVNPDMQQPIAERDEALKARQDLLEQEDGQYKVAMMYETGNNIHQDMDLALYWYETAAEDGSVAAMARLAHIYDEGIGVLSDDEEAAEWYGKAAAAGDADAMNTIGMKYIVGKGVKQDYEQALAWFERAAALGHANAMYNAGCLYESGNGTERDYAKALALFEKAAAAGDIDSLYKIGRFYEMGLGITDDAEQALVWYKKALDQGQRYAQTALDHLQRILSCKQRAEAGNVDDMFTLGTMYEAGRDIKQSDALALQWYKKASELGHDDAMQALAILLCYGDEPIKNVEQGLCWFQQSAMAGNINSMYALGNLYGDAEGICPDVSQAVYWYQQAASCGYITAIYKVGSIYESGKYGTPDYMRVLQWYRSQRPLLLKLIDLYRQRARYLYPDIPPKKMKNVFNSYAKNISWLTEDDVLILHDDTLFGNAKDGFLVTVAGIVASEFPDRGLIKFQDIKDAYADDNLTLVLTSGQCLELSTLKKSIAEAVNDMLHYIISDDLVPQLVVKRRIAPPSPSVQDMDAAPAGQDGSVTADAGTSSVVYRFCPQCGHKLDENAKFCTQCGKKIRD
jgi:TPR repeat protein